MWHVNFFIAFKQQNALHNSSPVTTDTAWLPATKVNRTVFHQRSIENYLVFSNPTHSSVSGAPDLLRLPVLEICQCVTVYVCTSTMNNITECHFIRSTDRMHIVLAVRDYNGLGWCVIIAYMVFA